MLLWVLRRCDGLNTSGAARLAGHLPAVIVIEMQMAPVVPEFPIACAQLSAITPDSRPVTTESLVVAGPAILPESVVITPEVPTVTPNILAVLMNLTPGVLTISPQVSTNARP